MRKVKISEIPYGKEFYLFDDMKSFVYIKIKLPIQFSQSDCVIEKRQSGGITLLTVFLPEDDDFYFVED